MTTIPSSNLIGLPVEQLNLIEHFLADYNIVDEFLRKELDRDAHDTFGSLVRDYSKKNSGWHDDELLRTVAKVRNTVIHEKRKPYEYVAIPTPTIAKALQDCKERLIRPVRVIPKVQQKVKTVAPSESLANVLKLIAECDYSQFPVHDSNGFSGLLTESGITRWLSRHVKNVLSLVELNDITIEQVLQDEEKRVNWLFVDRNKRLDDVTSLFAVNPLLEAVLITANGKPTEALLGIATRWDMVQ